MNNIEQLFSSSKGINEYAAGYFKYLCELLNKLDLAGIESFVKEIQKTRSAGKRIFIAGNGGSASSASHMANDIGLDVWKKSGTDKPFKVFSLTDNIPVITAIGNDNGYENIFLYQLQILYEPDDMLVVISASGNSKNIVKAAEWVRERNGMVLGILGFDGGKLKDLCDIFILAETPKGEYGPVEDIHIILDHLIGSYLQLKLAEDRKTE